jgi:glutathione S-transferase
MTKRRLVHTTFLFLLPLIVAAFGISLAGAVALVLLALLWRWLISLSAWVAPAKLPELELETISASHFVEKVRWCMDRLGVEYRERPVGGTLGAFYLGRSVPVLHFRSGAVRSAIGNSMEILRYLWGRYGSERGAGADFLAADAERLELERRIDRCGVELQVWVYFHLLDKRELTLHAWGCNSSRIPAWQRLALRLLYPLQAALIRKAFRITPGRHAKAVQHIDALLAEIEEKLTDGRRSILGGEEPNYTDFAFCAIMGLWLQPAAYGGGQADEVRIERDRCPALMIGEIERWEEGYPLTTAFVERLYAEWRRPGA